MGKLVGTNKDVQKLINLAESNGFRVIVTGKNHLKWTAPDRSIYFCGLTSGDNRVTLNKLKNWLVAKGCPDVKRK